jgi:acyl carrier protein
LDTKENLRNFIIENFMFGSEDASLDDDDSFLDEGIIDSTGVLEVVGFIEDEFGFEVSDDELVPENFDSLNKLLSYVNGKVQTTG